ncbi:MAG: ABC transporter ATP-binding protein [Parvibaculaceae bacterium]|nr:ABC transporter ATP-binding protein [Parvibaculaceae bacterium]
MVHTSDSSPAGPLIEIHNLVKRFGPFTAVDRVSFSVARGEVLGFLGPNGAGKSTTMKMATGFLTPSEGDIRVCGFDVQSRRLSAQRAIGYLPEGAPAYPEMTPRGFLRFIARIRRLSGQDADQAITSAINATELEQVLDQPIDTLSKGYRRRVGLAQAILHNPPVLIMDEPTDGLDPNQKYQVRELIGAMARHKAIVISTHILEEVDAICTRALIIDRGRIVADGTPGELLARSRYHNAVSITLDTSLAEQAALLLRAVHGVAAVEEIRRGPETIFTLFTTVQGEADTTLVDHVSRLVRERGWQVRALYREPGRLDEVFRRLTRGDRSGQQTKPGAAA